MWYPDQISSLDHANTVVSKCYVSKVVIGAQTLIEKPAPLGLVHQLLVSSRIVLTGAEVGHEWRSDDLLNMVVALRHWLGRGVGVQSG